MAFTIDDAIEGICGARKHFLKHLDGLRDDQWDWRAHAECKSIRDTLAHLVDDDRVTRDCLDTGSDPNYASYNEPERDIERLKTLLAQSHEQVTATVRARFSDSALDTPVRLWGVPMKLGSALSLLTAEDIYHAGQVAYIRIATDPSWDYYAAVYGGDGA